jgi:GxxExxY protein
VRRVTRAKVALVAGVSLAELRGDREAMPMLQHEGTKLTKDTKTSLLALSHEIIGAAIEVHRWLGPGLLESVYEAALCNELRLRGMSVERQVSLPVTYKGEVLDCCLKLDLVVNNKIIVEVKSVDKLLSVHKSQLLTYLRLQGLWLGLLINFHCELLRDGVRRVLNG